MKKNFQRLSRPWKISLYCAGTVFALFLLFFTAQNVIEYRQYAVQQRQIRDAEKLAEKSEKSNDFPGKVPKTVNMRLDKSPHHYDTQ